MKNLYQLLAIGIVVLLFASSCGSSTSDCESATLNDSFTQATNEITNALVNVNPSDPNSCDDFKKALRNYIDELDSLQDCANDVGQGTEWREAINEAKDQLDDFSC